MLLYDLLFFIFQYLNGRTLRNAAQVCSSWNCAAKREILRRGEMYYVILPVSRQTLADMRDLFTKQPRTILVFCAPTKMRVPIFDFEAQVQNNLYKRLSCEIVMLGAENVMINRNDVHSCIQNWCTCAVSAETVVNSVVGLSLPINENLKIKIVECSCNEANSHIDASFVFKTLYKAARNVSNPIFLLFSRNGYTVGSRIMQMFQERYANQPISLWGSEISNFIKRSDDGSPDYLGTHGFLGILLYGPRLTAQCLVVPIIPEENIMIDKLAKFAVCLKRKLRGRSVGLICGPGNSKKKSYKQLKESSIEKYQANNFMALVKKQIPNVDFIGMFNEKNYAYYGRHESSENNSLEHKLAFSIIVINFD